MIKPSLALVCLFFYSLVLGLSSNFYIFMLLPFLWVFWTLKYELTLYLKKLVFLNLFILLIVISLLLSKAYNEALLIFLRSNAIIAMALFLFWKQDAFAISKGIQNLKFPAKFTSLFFFTAKFIVLIKTEFNVFKKTLKLRGFYPTTSIFTYKTYANFIGMLIIKSFRRAKRLEDAMMLRGFDGELYTLNDKQSLHVNEICFLILLFISLAFPIGFIV